MVNQKILIIEDDKDIAALEKDFLEINGFTVIIEGDGIKGAERALSEDFALILLDLMLPGKDGRTVCREIRKKIDIPILMVTARIEDADKVRGLGLGADDYITKPFSPAELVARVKSHLARYERLTRNADAPKKTDKIDFGWIQINHAARRVFVNDKEIALAHKEYELLYFLADNKERVFSKEQLYDKIWGEDMYGDIKTVAVHINRLREKIEHDPANPIHIQTLWGAGYRFMA
ncbi:MAG: response regulator transcription factor [Spirochaetaceae bacterium]|jgi:DNA-binding response OmpR family regulator|nr:response regulator transcription factor [Spirochaetaceae bacterium]